MIYYVAYYPAQYRSFPFPVMQIYLHAYFLNPQFFIDILYIFNIQKYIFGDFVLFWFIL